MLGPCSEAAPAAQGGDREGDLDKVTTLSNVATCDSPGPCTARYTAFDCRQSDCDLRACTLLHGSWLLHWTLQGNLLHARNSPTLWQSCLCKSKLPSVHLQDPVCDNLWAFLGSSHALRVLVTSIVLAQVPCCPFLYCFAVTVTPLLYADRTSSDHLIDAPKLFM